MKKIINALSVVVLSMLAFSQPSMARDFADIYTQCGLGAMIAPKSDAVAAVTNVTWDSGTTAISSNISSPDSCQGGKPKTAAFILESYGQIEKDLARGSGSHLEALLTLSGCRTEARSAISAELRKDFSAVVAKSGYSRQSRYDQANGLYNMLHARIGTSFSGSCSIA